jgi:hypothetical protein
MHAVFKVGPDNHEIRRKIFEMGLDLKTNYTLTLILERWGVE